MTEYTATNGITIYVRDGGTVQFQHGTREELCGIIQIFPASEWWQTLREFFQHERDTELGRWRSTASPDFVVHALTEDVIAVVDERNGTTLTASRSDMVVSEHGDVAVEFFDAHPEPKPWYDAKPGEAWVITVDGVGEFAATVDTDSGFPRFISLVDEMGYGPRAGITAGRRIWPEVQP